MVIESSVWLRLFSVEFRLIICVQFDMAVYCAIQYRVRCDDSKTSGFDVCVINALVRIKSRIVCNVQHIAHDNSLDC